MPHVLIVGAGPAGASLAYLLAHRGIEVTLLERQRDFAREFRGEFLMPSGVQALEQMSLGDALDAVPSHVLTAGTLYLSGRVVFDGKVDLSEEPYPPRAVSQPALLEMLVAEAAKAPSFRLERGVAVRDLLREGDRVVGVLARNEEGEQELRADLVIGADGRGSSVRKHAGLPVQRFGQPMDIVWCKLPCPDDWPGVCAFAGHGQLLIAYRTWDESLQLGWVILKGTFGELRSRGMPEWIDEMANHVSPEFGEHLRAHADAARTPFLLSTEADCVDTWSAPGVLVIGDAAHTMSPVGGQGINIALRDAIVAANHLMPALCEPGSARDPLGSALDRIEDERMQEVSTIQRLQRLPPRIMLNRSWLGEPLRRVIGTLLSNPTLRSLAQRRAGDTFAFGTTRVQLDV